MIILFSVLPLIGGAGQILLPRLPLLWAFGTASLMIVFISLQNRQISLDGLTNINNRRTLNRYIESRFADLKGDEALFLLMLDVDHFKHINDTFGHAAGDAALIKTAEILKKVCGQENYFLARFGGDEFAIVFVRAAHEKADDVVARINQEADALNQSGLFPYSLSYSAGYASISAGARGGVEALVGAADRWMYKRKRGGAKAPTERM